MTEYPEAVIIKKEYLACPHCGGDQWGATNPKSEGRLIYQCHGFTAGMMSVPGCGGKFVIAENLNFSIFDEDDDD